MSFNRCLKCKRNYLKEVAQLLLGRFSCLWNSLHPVSQATEIPYSHVSYTKKNYFSKELKTPLPLFWLPLQSSLEGMTLYKNKFLWYHQ